MKGKDEFNVGDILVYNIPSNSTGKICKTITWNDGTIENYTRDWTPFNHHKFEVLDVKTVYCIDGMPFRAVYVRDITKPLGAFKIPNEQLSCFSILRKKNNRK